MPARDKTGPEGKGPRTGRGMGPCTDADLEKFNDQFTRAIRGENDPNAGYTYRGGYRRRRDQGGPTHLGQTEFYHPENK
jgi:hypothetical protein